MLRRKEMEQWLEQRGGPPALVSPPHPTVPPIKADLTLLSELESLNLARLGDQQQHTRQLDELRAEVTRLRRQREEGELQRLNLEQQLRVVQRTVETRIASEQHAVLAQATSIVDAARRDCQRTLELNAREIKDRERQLNELHARLTDRASQVRSCTCACALPCLRTHLWYHSTSSRCLSPTRLPTPGEREACANGA